MKTNSLNCDIVPIRLLTNPPPPNMDKLIWDKYDRFKGPTLPMEIWTNFSKKYDSKKATSDSFKTV